MGWNKKLGLILWGLIHLLLLYSRDVLGFYTPYQAAQVHARALHNAQTTRDQAPYEFKIHHVVNDLSESDKQGGVESVHGSQKEDQASHEFKINHVLDLSEKQREVEGIEGLQSAKSEKQAQQSLGLDGGVEVSQIAKSSSSSSSLWGDDREERPADDMKWLTDDVGRPSENVERPVDNVEPSANIHAHPSENSPPRVEPPTPPSSSLAVANNYYYFTMCDYGGEKYPVGSFHPDPCTNCHCNATTGKVTCASQTCPPRANCIEFAPPTPGDSSCCPRCVKVGCYFHGRAYPPGAKIDSGACEKCYCPWEGGDLETGAPTCLTIQCPPLRCVDADVPRDKCCPVCPNGPNCWLDHKVIPEGERIYIDKCRYCYCSNLEYIFNATQRHATCVRSFFCL